MGAQAKKQPAFPKELVQQLAGKRIALIGFPKNDAARLSEAFDHVQAFTREFAFARALANRDELLPFDMLVYHVPPEPPREAWPQDWIEQGNATQQHKPHLFIGQAHSLLQYLPKTAISTYDFLLTPWHTEEVVVRAYHTLLAASPVRSEPVTTGALNKTRILIADDDPTMTTLVSAVVRKSGMDCLVAHNGGEAFELAKAQPPQAVISDVNMPQLDGFELLATLKRQPELRHIPVILLTGRLQEIDVLRGFGLGADDYITKPFNPMELAARLKRLLARAA